MKPVPEELRKCFAGTVPWPPGAEWSREEVTRLIADLRQSEYAKTQCGRDLLSFYDEQVNLQKK
jgi:hypothetical protein